MLCSYRGFVLEFLNGLIVCTEKSIGVITELINLKTKDENKISSLVKTLNISMKILGYLREKPLIVLRIL